MTAPQDHEEPALAEILPRPLDRRVLVILLLTPLLLTLSRYYGSFNRDTVSWLGPVLGWLGVEDARTSLLKIFSERFDGRAGLWRLLYWVAAHTLLYLVIPAVVVKLVFRERLVDYGLKLSGWWRRLWIYLGAFAVVLPFVIMVRGTESFQNTYPFYKNAHHSWGDFVGWELAYALQFFALEFFFRGFLIHGLKHRFGVYSVLIMTVPYCMIHFQKPVLETIGAIIAGVFLGVLSLWTRSIWLGVLIHISVAVSMDLAAMHYRGDLQALLG